MVYREQFCFTCRGLVRAGEEEEGALPTASDEGQAEPCDSSLWCCSGDRLSLLLSSSNAYESSCFGNLPWFTAKGGEIGEWRQWWGPTHRLLSEGSNRAAPHPLCFF